MIPKIIHYCWFGGAPLPKKAQKCVASWRKFFPDFEIIEWNEQNYDVSKIPYTHEAYHARKYAFVSDYARFEILHQHGGIYFDTDVEVIKSFDDILTHGAFMGCETDGNPELGKHILVNTGLGLGTAAGNPFFKEVLNYYREEPFLNPDGSLNTTTVVTRTTELLFANGLQDKPGVQKVRDITIYPKEYFNPRNNNTGAMERTSNTHSIHWYAQSWDSPLDRLRSKLTRPIHRIFGEDCFVGLRGLEK